MRTHICQVLLCCQCYSDVEKGPLCMEYMVWVASEHDVTWVKSLSSIRCSKKTSVCSVSKSRDCTFTIQHAISSNLNWCQSRWPTKCTRNIYTGKNTVVFTNDKCAWDPCSGWLQRHMTLHSLSKYYFLSLHKLHSTNNHPRLSTTWLPQDTDPNSTDTH